MRRGSSLEMIRGRVEQMTDEDWQNRRLVLDRGGRDSWGNARFARDSVHTRVYRVRASSTTGPTFLGVPAVHFTAPPSIAESPLDWKPRTCWQVPLFFEIDEKTQKTTVRAVRTADWGEEGIPRLVVHRA
jgi:hypothetical protein